MGEKEKTFDDDKKGVKVITGVCVRRKDGENAALFDAGWLIEGDSLADSDASALDDTVAQKELLPVREFVLTAVTVKQMENDAEKEGEYVVDRSEEAVAVTTELEVIDKRPDAVASDLVALTDAEAEKLPPADALSIVIVT